MSDLTRGWAYVCMMLICSDPPYRGLDWRGPRSVRRRREVEEVQETLLRDFGALPQLGEVAVAARTQHSITVTWTSPQLHGAVLKGIHVYRNRQHVRTLTADQRRVKLTGLEPGTAYEVTVVFHTTAARLTSPVLRVATRGPTDFSGICVAFSLFSAPEVAELRQLVDQLGGRYTDEFSPENTHLVCKAPAGTRYEQARHWNVPAVGPEWLRECIARGTFPAARQHYAERHEITAYFPNQL